MTMRQDDLCELAELEKAEPKNYRGHNEARLWYALQEVQRKERLGQDDDMILTNDTL